jgi:hypothetical protein
MPPWRFPNHAGDTGGALMRAIGQSRLATAAVADQAAPSSGPLSRAAPEARV